MPYALSSDSIAPRRLDEATVVGDAAPPRVAVASTTPMQHLDAAEMARLGVTDVAGAVRQMSGAEVRDYGGIGGMKTVSIRNLGAAHTEVSYDGMPVGRTLSGAVDVGRFGGSRVGGVTLHVGPIHDLVAPARLGVAAGVVAIAADTTAERLALRVDYGSWNTADAALDAATTLRERHRLSIHAAARHTDGDYPFTLTNGRTRSREHRNHGEVNDQEAEASWRVRTARAGAWATTVMYRRSDRQLPGGVIFYNPVSHERLSEEQILLQSRWTQRWGGRWTATAAWKYEHGWTRYRDEGDQYDGGWLSDTYREAEWIATCALRYRASDHVDLALAHDEQWNTFRSSLPDCPYPLRHSAYTALRARYRARRFTVLAALVRADTRDRRQHRLPRGSAAAAPDAPALCRPVHQFAPSVSAGWRPCRADVWLRAFGGRALRIPSFNDLYYQRIGNRGLRPEKADAYGAGATAVWRGISLTADTYYNYVRDKIVAFPTTFAWKMANFGRVEIWGIDVNAAYDRRWSERFALRLAAAYSFQDATDRTDRASSTYGHRIPYTARHSGHASATVATPWLTLGYTAAWMGERYSNSMQTRRYRLAPFAKHSLTASHAFPLAKSSRRHRPQLELMTTVENLTDEQYDIIQYYPMPGRRWRIGLRVAL